jgi:TRCF domain/Helicase conserved C-terminal domain
VATTIIESGLDIPNANTMFIHEADRYGLADLHQLRGRVGRHKNRAYAYLLLDSDRGVTPDAARRLKAIEEFTELGAGFKIALRDLEIRGAGNILGTQQSGHIAAVGYELYCQLLENSVRQMKKLPAKAPLETTIDLPWPAYLPHDYVPNQKGRIEVYRRLARVRDAAKLDDFRQELRDRYGPLPEPAEWLLRAAEVRLLAARWGVTNVHRLEKDLVLTYRSGRLIKKLADRAGSRLRVVDEKSTYWRLRPGDEEPRVMAVAQALGSGLVGACALTGVHESARRVVPHPPRMDVLGMRSIAKVVRAAGGDPPRGQALHEAALAGDVVANALYYALVGAGDRDGAWRRGLALGLLAGLGAVALPGRLGLGRPPGERAPWTPLMTVAWYTLGGLAAAAAYRAFTADGGPAVGRDRATELAIDVTGG